MAPPRTYHCEALTLKQAPFGEADLLVTLFSRERGKLRAIAKGARRSNSKLVGHLEPITHVRLALNRGRDLDYVTQAQVIDSFPAVKNDLQAIARGFYVAELVDGFGSEAHQNLPLYDLALATLGRVGEENPHPELVLRSFELGLLRASGFMPELYRCVECGEDLVPDRHRFSVDLGGVLCLECRPPGAHIRPLTLRALKVLRLLDRTPLTEVPPLQIDEALARELKTLLGFAVEYWLDKRIMSQSVLDQVAMEAPA